MTTHVEELAVRLRELKERSGRSYGQLSGRLHLSTSTLHRYCNGAAVPSDYAPVERLARLCGATPEELLALHRLWVLADATRRDLGHAVLAVPPGVEATPASGSPGGEVPWAVPAEEGEPARESGPAPAGGPGALDGSGREGEVSGPGGAAPDGGPDASGESAPSPGPAPDGGPAISRESAPSAEPAADGDSVPVAFTGSPAEGEPDAAGPSAWAAQPAAAPRRSRRAALVAGAMAAVAAVAVLPLTLHGGGDSGGSGQVAGAVVPSATHRTTPGSPTAPASPPAMARTPSVPSLAPSAPPSTSPAVGPSLSTTSPGAQSGGPAPFHVNVLSDNWDRQCGQWFLLPQYPGEVPPPPSLDRTDAWASALGGVPAGHLRLQLTAQTGATQPIVLHALYVHIVSSRPAAKGTAYTPGSGCGGGLEPAAFAVDLEATAPRAKPVRGFVDDGTTRALSTFPYRISATDPQVLDVDASTTGRDVSWYLELSWSSGDRSGKLTVDDGGRPFRTVGLQGDPAYFYDGTAWSRTTVFD